MIVSFKDNLVKNNIRYRINTSVFLLKGENMKKEINNYQKDKSKIFLSMSIAIIMAVLGVLAIFTSAEILNSIIFIIFVILTMIGIIIIARYFKQNKNNRNTWILLGGILNLATGIIVLFTWIFTSNDIANKTTTQILALIFAFLCIVDVINIIRGGLSIKQNKIQFKLISLTVLSSLAILLIILPIFTNISLKIVLGGYLLIAGFSKFFSLLD